LGTFSFTSLSESFNTLKGVAVSTTILIDSFNSLNIQCDKRFVVSIGREELATLVRNRMEELNLSTNAVARKSGHKISNGTVWNIANNRVKDVKEDTLRALARGIDLPEDEVLAAYYGKQVEPDDSLEGIKVLFNGWHEASEADRAATMELIRMIADGFQKKRRRTAKPKSDNTNGKK
jgi:transcriptional regulator with XRE-family HTH domain